jgi:hypothetical protein
MSTLNNRDFARVATTARLREQSDANVRDDADYRRSWEHADALLDNAQFDIDREANRARLQSLADQHLADKRDLPPPESCCARDARINEGFDETPTDGEILDVYVENFGGTREQAIERLALFDAVVARAEMVPA